MQGLGGLIFHVPGFKMTQLKSYCQVEGTMCARHDITRRISVAVKGKTDTEAPLVSEYERVIPSPNAISTMKGTSFPLPGSGQIAKGGRCGPHSGWASNVSRKPGHQQTFHSWPLSWHHLNSASSISVRANNISTGRSHRSMPRRCSIVSAIVTDPIRCANCLLFRLTNESQTQHERRTRRTRRTITRRYNISRHNFNSPHDDVLRLFENE